MLGTGARGPWLALAVLAAAFAARPVQAQAVGPIESYAVTDGVVRTLAEATGPGGLLYFGGEFATVAPPTGAFAPFKESGGLSAGFPKVDGGSVYAAVADGAGGFIVGGDFTRVTGLGREGLAHILSDGRLSTWAPRVLRGGGSGRVFALARVGTQVYVGGDFDAIVDVASQARSNLAMVDLASGLVDAFNPGPDLPVRALDAFDGYLYAGGDFTQMTLPAVTPRSRIAAFDLATGVLEPSWDPNVLAGAGAPVVDAIEASAAGVFVGGRFSAAGGQARNNLAALDPAPGSGAALGFNPSPDGEVLALVRASSGRLYVGGRFLNIAASGTPYLAELDATGANTLWNPRPNAEVAALALDDAEGLLFAGGRFTAVGASATPRRRAAAYDLPGLGLRPWEAHAVGPVLALAVSLDSSPTTPEERVGVGGAFAGVGGVVRGNAAAVDPSSGAIAAWDPDVNGPVLALALQPGPPASVFLGGSFSTVNGSTVRRSLAKVDGAAGGALAWTADLALGTVYVAALAYDGAGALYVGGVFPGLLGLPLCGNFAKLDADVMPLLQLWCGFADGEVNAIWTDGTKVYLGGDFTHLGLLLPPVRTRLAEFNSLGALQALDGNANGIVRSLSVATDIFVGGDFTTLGTPSTSRKHAGALTTAGALTNWAPDADASVAAVLATSSSVYLGGAFATLKAGTIPRGGLAQLDQAGSGTVLPWNPALGGAFAAGPTAANAITTGTQRLHTGGDFLTVDGDLRSGLASFCLEQAPTSAPVVAFLGDNLVRLTWSGPAPSYNLYRQRAGGALALLANVAGNSYDDLEVEAGVTYTYTLRAVNGCESDASAPVTATPTGVCGLAPEFDGVTAAVQEAGPDCAVRLAWPAAKAPCGGAVAYSVYRGSAPGFTVDRGSRIATLLPGTSYADSAALAPGDWYYVVRAQELPRGEEDANPIYAAVTVTGCAASAPGPAEKLTTRSNGFGSATPENTLTWVNPPGPASLCGELVRKEGSVPTGPADGTSLGCSAGANAKIELLDAGPLTLGGDYRYAVFASAAALYAAPAFSHGRPGASDDAVWKYTTGASALVTAGVIPNGAYYTVSNDRLVHGMTPGSAGGFWPTSPLTFTPHVLNGPAQGRPTVVSLASGVPAARLVLVGSADSSVTAVDGQTGGLLWRSVLSGEESVLAPLAAMFSDFGGAYDLVLAATRNSTGPNAVWALSVTTGALAWTYRPSPDMGVVHGGPLVDYATSRLFWTSRTRSGGSSNTVWCRQFTASASSDCAGWPGPGVAVGDIDSAPALRSGRLYVSTTAGHLVILDASDGSVVHDVAGVGDARGGLRTLGTGGNTQLFLSTGTSLVAYQDNVSPPGAPAPLWTVPGLVSASAPLVFGGKVYVGTAGGQLRAFSTATGANAGTRTLGASILGAPTRDTATNLLLVGAEDGVVYAIPAF